MSDHITVNTLNISIYCMSNLAQESTLATKTETNAPANNRRASTRKPASPQPPGCCR